MTLLKDLIDIPDHVQQGDFVLRLAEDVTKPHLVLDNYVVTPELKSCFDSALAFIHSAIQGQTSKASYLHGSFGSGKSHFMAVLHLILQGNVEARSITELAPVIQKHNDWITGKKFLLVPYHMIGSRDMESGILGGYVDFIRANHPHAPIPGVYLAEGLFKDAESLRQRLGDEEFFAVLSESTEGGSGWGELEGEWDAPRYSAAMEADPGSDERAQLISVLIGKFFSSYDVQSASSEEAFVSLDKGLSIVSKHAASLGYDAVILFLDELILWLASHAAEMSFIHQEGQKLAKLVEAQTPDRPIPIISFVARQRDLRELIGENVPGADRLNFGDALKHWEGRFHRITLEDRNLPVIAEKRILRCKSSSARAQLDAAFEKTARMKDNVMNILLTREGDREMFRRVYPFSPALVQTLIAVSSVLQRERTALRVMKQLLVEQRETLTIDDVIPVGDLFDIVAHGDEAFSQEMAIHFNNAKRLYHQKLLPLLEKEHGIRFESIDKLPLDDGRRIAFRNDDRLIKTLLLSALVPQVESLRGLNPEKLAALNHGTIKTPVTGREGQEVLRRCHQWAKDVGEIRVGDEANPTISVELIGVDTETIIAQARGEDSQGNRRRRIRQMLFEQLGIASGEFESQHEFWWRGTKRNCVIIYSNIRDLTDSSLENVNAGWKLIIDFPFDEHGYGPRDDLSRLQKFQQTHKEGSHTICWIPSFFSAEANKDLGQLVILEHILNGERFEQYANHLSLIDRQAAKSVLENQRRSLKDRVLLHLDVAYGLDSRIVGSVDTTHDLEMHEHYVSLLPGFSLQAPVSANLKQAMDHLLDQSLSHEFPAAPKFEVELKPSLIKKVYELILRSTESSDGRVPIEKKDRVIVSQVADPLRIGETHEQVFVVGQHWKNHFSKKAAETESGFTVKQLRRWIDDPKPMGLPKEAQALIIMMFAAQTNRTFYLHGAPRESTITDLDDANELRAVNLPEAAEWNTAVQRAGSIFGVVIPPLLTGAAVERLTSQIRQKATEAQKGLQSYRDRLRSLLGEFGISLDASPRYQTATATVKLIDQIVQSDPSHIVAKLAKSDIATSEAAMGECFEQSNKLAAVLELDRWDLLFVARDLTDHRRTNAEEILKELKRALSADEHVLGLATSWKEAQGKVVNLLKAPLPPSPPPTVEVEKKVGPDPIVTGKTIERGEERGLSIDGAVKAVERIRGLCKEGAQVRITISWTIEKE